MGREEFIASLVKRHGWTRGAELGLWRGRTFGYLLRECEALHLIGVDLFGPQPEHPEYGSQPSFGEEWGHDENEQVCLDIADRYPGRAEVIKDYTTNAAKVLPDEYLDFVFIDADHTSEGVLRDIEDWEPKVKKGGYVMGHDIDWESVRSVVAKRLPGYRTGPDNVWYRQK